MTKHLPLVLSVFVAVVLIAGSLYLKDGASTALGASRGEEAVVYGNEHAPMRVVLYSDFECPFCKVLFPVLKKLVDENPDRISFEYRHLPLQKHLRAEAAAYASECVHELRGNDAFWSYTEALYSGADINKSALEARALEYGLTESDLSACMEREDIRMRVTRDRDQAVLLGAGGTPFSVIVYEDGTEKTVSGALPEATWRKLLLE